MKRLLLCALTVTSCAMPDPIPDADRAFARGDYAQARKQYTKAGERFLTPTERKHVVARLRRAVDSEFTQKFEEAKRELAGKSKAERVEGYALLWREMRGASSGDPEVLAQISAAIDDELSSEWEAVDALMKDQKIAEAITLAASWAKHAPADSAAAQAYMSRRALAAQYYASRIASATGPVTKAVLAQLTAFYGGDNVDRAAATATLENLRRVPIGYTFTGAAANCSPLPTSAADAVVTVSADISNCGLKVEQSEFEEAYTWTTVTQVQEKVTECAKEQTGTRQEPVSSNSSCTWQQGAAGVLDFYVCTTSSTFRNVPVFQTVCREKTIVRDVVTEHEGTRTVQVKTSSFTLAASYSATLPDGSALRASFQETGVAEERQWDTPQGSQAFPGGGADEAAAQVAERFQRAIDAVRSPYRAARAAVALGDARNGVDPTENRATAAALGTFDPSWLSELGTTAQVLAAALAGQTSVVPSDPPAAYEVRSIALGQVNAGSFFGTDATAARGFPASHFEFGLRYRAVSNIPTQADRVGLTAVLSQSFSGLSLAQRNGWGVAFEDRFSYFLDFGGRVSTPHVYRNFGGGEDETENWGSGGAGIAYLLAVALRSNHVGLRIGARAHASTFKLGDLAAAETGAPLTAQLELRLNERYPLLLEAWGFSPFGDKALLGAKLSQTFGNGVYLVAEVELAEPTINVGGRNEDDRVRVGRHPTQIASALVSWQF